MNSNIPLAILLVTWFLPEILAVFGYRLEFYSADYLRVANLKTVKFPPITKKYEWLVLIVGISWQIAFLTTLKLSQYYDESSSTYYRLAVFLGLPWLLFCVGFVRKLFFALHDFIREQFVKLVSR